MRSKEAALWVGAYARVAETGEAAHIERVAIVLALALIRGLLAMPAGDLPQCWLN
jgi:hypothetical protein